MSGERGERGETRRPVELARRAAEQLRQQDRRAAARRAAEALWCRNTFALPRDEARDLAREMLSRFPRAAYMTEIESWRELEDGRIEFTIRRLPSAD